MQKYTENGHEFEFELADEKFPTDRLMPFYVKTLDGAEYDKYHVVLGKTDSEADIPKNPVDGHIVAICLTKEDALMVTAAIRMAKRFSDMSEAFDGKMKDVTTTARENAKRNGWDVDAAEAKMDELIKQGKSPSEILAYMKEHKSDFKKPDAPKSAEEW